jgi:hypothetical protein
MRVRYKKSSKKGRQSLHNREVGRYAKQRERTEANKARRRLRAGLKAR